MPCRHTEQKFNNIYFSEHFKPGKLNVEKKWKPVENQTINIVTDENPVKRKFKALDDVYQSSNAMTNHKTYHIPPGIYQNYHFRNR